MLSSQLHFELLKNSQKSTLNCGSFGCSQANHMSKIVILKFEKSCNVISKSLDDFLFLNKVFLFVHDTSALNIISSDSEQAVHKKQLILTDAVSSLHENTL